MRKCIFIVFIVVIAIVAIPHAFVSAETLPLTASSTPADTQSLIAELQRLIVSLQAQIIELKAKLETTQQEVAVVKSEIQFTTFLAKGAQGDDIAQLQEILKQDPEVYPEGSITGFFGPATEAAVKRFQEKHHIEALGVIGPKTRAKLNELITQGAGKSGVIPSGLTNAAGIQRLGTTAATSSSVSASTTPVNAVGAIATTTPSIATTSPVNLCAKDAKYCASKEACVSANFFWYTVSCHTTPPPTYSCAASYNYCISPTECSAHGWYSCKNSCYPSLDACQGQTYVPPAQTAAVPAVPAQSVGQTGTTTVPAIPAQISTSTTDTIPPSIPANFTASATGYYSPVWLSWSKSSDNVGVVGYKLYRNDMLLSSAATSSTLATLSYTDSSITLGSNYTYAVAAYDAAENVSVQATTAVTTPSTPTTTSGNTTCSGLNLTFKNNKTSYVIGETVTYTYACTPSGSTSYVEIQVVKPDNTATTYNSASGNVSTNTLGFGTSNLVAGDYTLRACFTAGCSSVTASLPFAITTSTATPPAPSGLTANMASYSSPTSPVVDLTWTGNTNNVTEFRIFNHPQQTAWPTNYDRRGLESTGTATSDRILGTNIGLTTGSSGMYEFKMQACNSYGCSVDSNIATVAVGSVTATTTSDLNVNTTLLLANILQAFNEIFQKLHLLLK
ncbi:MAG: hypothetical protein A3J58_03380 [Candidatus Sungbacteria bacterium RIFCSPHIGHO2_02_FULL_52_23]|uniref:Fibronectin type-III domain-containing protein n=1 Tax=Candidatus Sungbacteria bacterium RIFCSPHIGHO2_02_FULL_52_23 TaxID=1802274 RepID=A0A1G2KXW6_9BACT|nr:MAG: hypothetical protein A3J58_03380 [Candidatus Sungbacteria bacterium RIFCSPHIGHO2_02_FULL_52_23]